MLTDTAVRKAKAGEKPYKIADSGGLFLYVTPAGGKLWRLKYRFNRKEKLLSIGPYPDVSIVDARAERDKAKAALRENRDPAVAKEQNRAAAIANHEATFESIARKWHALQTVIWSEKHAKKVLDDFENDVFPSIGHLPVKGKDCITSANILTALQAVEERGAIETARRIRIKISNVFVYAIASGLAENDPASSIGKALKRSNKGRYPGLTNLDKVRQILRDTDGDKSTGVLGKLAMRLIALTSLRSGTLISTPWEELPKGIVLWKIPAERMKLKEYLKQDESRDHWAPLSLQAIETIEALRKISIRAPFVFPNSRKAHGHMSRKRLSQMLERAGYAGRHVPHGWRTSFSTIMNEAYPLHSKIIDFMLAHAQKGETEKAYNRAAYLDLRTELAQIWADKLMVDQKPLEDILSERQIYSRTKDRD